MLLCAAASFPAQAQAQAQAPRAPACYAAPAAAGEAGAHSRNLCMRDIVDGHAAVRLPAVDIPIDDAARMAEGERWGFLDAQGALAIAPQFLAVDDFRHGLAAVRTERGWGYVDAQGKWAIEPSYAYAGPFAESGLALVRTAERWQVIDRQGALVHELDAGVAQATLEGAAPSRLALRYARRHLAPQGEEVAVPGDVTLVEPLGSDGLLVARRGDAWGLLDRAGQWRVDPRYAAIEPWRGPGVAGAASAREPSGALRVLRANGEVSNETYEQARALAGRYVALVSGDGVTHLFRSSGDAVLSLPPEQGISLRDAGAFLTWQTPEGRTRVLAPRAKEPIDLPRDRFVRAANGPVLVLGQEAEGPVSGLVLPSGRTVDTDDALASVARIERHGERIWLADSEGRWLDVLDLDGRSVLAPPARQALREGSWQRLDGAGMPLALARARCGCATGGAGLIDAEGQLVSDRAWDGLLPDDDAAGRGVAPRFRVSTAQGMGVLDEHGGVVLAPRLAHIGAFRGDHAVAYAEGATFALDRQGERHALPDVFLAEPIGGAWFRFLDSALAGSNWGIYDVERGEVVQTPPLAAVGQRDGDATQAAVRTDDGLRWGMLGPDGQWRVQPTFAAFERLANGDWKAISAGAPEEARIGIAAPSGRWLIEPLERLEIVSDTARGWVAAAGARSWMSRPGDDGVLASAPGERYVQQDGWVVVERAPQVGFLKPDGNWALAPFDADGASAFTAQRRTALVWRGDRAWLVDEAGNEIARLPDGPGWRWPAQAEGPYRVRRGEGGKRATQYADATGKITHTLDGVGGPRMNGAIVLNPVQGRVTRLDVNAKQSVSWPFDSLRPSVSGPAAAGVRGRYGYVDVQGRYVLAPVYAAAQPFAGERAVVSTADQSLLIDAAGRPLARVERECGIHVLYGAGSARVWPKQMPVRCPPA